MLKYVVLVMFLAGVSLQAEAARVWEVQDNYVEEVSMYLDTVGSTGYHVLSVKLKNPVSTGCALTDSTRTLTWWSTADAGFAVSMWYSTLLSAHAQGLKVDIRTENTNCNATYGRQLIGARVKSK